MPGSMGLRFPDINTGTGGLSLRRLSVWDLRHKFLMAQRSDVDDVSRLSEDQLVRPWNDVPFRGIFRMIGVSRG